MKARCGCGLQGCKYLKVFRQGMPAKTDKYLNVLGEELAEFVGVTSIGKGETYKLRCSTSASTSALGVKPNYGGRVACRNLQ